MVGLAPAGGADSILNEESHPDVQLDQRHIMLRGENVSISIFSSNFFSQYKSIQTKCFVFRLVKFSVCDQP